MCFVKSIYIYTYIHRAIRVIRVIRLIRVIRVIRVVYIYVYIRMYSSDVYMYEQSLFTLAKVFRGYSGLSGDPQGQSQSRPHPSPYVNVDASQHITHKLNR